MKTSLEIVVLVISIIGTFVGVTWQLSQQKIEIIRVIDTEIKQINNSLEGIRYNLGIHMTEVKKDYSIFELKLETVEENLNNSLNRCWQEVREIQKYLTKTTGFTTRDKINSDRDE